MKEHGGEEKREFLRVEFEAPLEFDVCSKEVSERVIGFTKNISPCGVLFTVDKFIEPGTVIAIKFDEHTLRDVVELVDTVIEVKGKVLGRVVRVEEIVLKQKFDVGVCFVRSDKYQLENLDEIRKILE